jgi:hypothetical protein
VLFSIGQAFRQAGSKVLYFAGYKKMIDRYKVAISKPPPTSWSGVRRSARLRARSPQDRQFVGNIVEAMVAYASGALGEQPIRFGTCDRIIAIGSDRMMAAVGAARHTVLAPHLKPNHKAIGSINSPMQCMMKEICAQCLQPHKDPLTARSRTSFPASIRTSRWTKSTSRVLLRASRRIRYRKSSPANGSGTASITRLRPSEASVRR